MKLWLKNNLSKSEECVDTEPLACTDRVCYDYFEFSGNSNGTFLSRWSYICDGERAWVGKIVTNLGYCFQAFYGTGPCSTKNC